LTAASLAVSLNAVDRRPDLGDLPVQLGREHRQSVDLLGNARKLGRHRSVALSVGAALPPQEPADPDEHEVSNDATCGPKRRRSSAITAERGGSTISAHRAACDRH
jgi:hypothetical protein